MTEYKKITQDENMKQTREIVSALKALNAVIQAHEPVDITLPDGSWGLHCRECDGWAYPCLTIKIIRAYWA